MLKRTILRVATSHAGSGLFRSFARGSYTLFMLHRFEDPELGIRGHALGLVEGLLDRLSRGGCRFLDLDTAVEEISGAWAPQSAAPAVIFTLDDGYRDQVETAARLFPRYRCPATVFLTTGFLDGSLWLWWDRLEFILDRARPTVVEVGGTRVDLTSSGARSELVERLKKWPYQEIERRIGELAESLEVDLPPAPPDRYAPATWDGVREAEASGISFGAHTVRHPILARESDADAREEIFRSIERLREEVKRPSRIFAYPNGMQDDFGPREVELAREAGLQGAVTAYGGVFRLTAGQWCDPFRVPRDPFPDDLPRALASVLGFRVLQERLRGTSPATAKANPTE